MGAQYVTATTRCGDGLPKTRSGKIMRRVLRARALGLPEGDTTTMDDD
jgi:acetyl-CoA synthetase